MEGKSSSIINLFLKLSLIQSRLFSLSLTDQKTVINKADTDVLSFMFQTKQKKPKPEQSKRKQKKNIEKRHVTKSSNTRKGLWEQK